MTPQRKMAVIAVGGNALIPDRDRATVADQFEVVAAIAQTIAELIDDGWTIAITHGNGPQIGFMLRRSELAIAEVPPDPMDYAVADTQGAIGYMFQRALINALRRRGIDREPITVVTQILVDRDDPAFAAPDKPIGSFLDPTEAARHAATQGWTVRPQGKRGWRRVVASPRPVAILEIDAIRTLIAAGHIVITCGGGGIPVYADDRGALQGVEAVIDKDYASDLLAREFGAELLIMVTEVDRVALDFGTPRQRWLDRMSASEAHRHLAAGQFPAGSMGPKVGSILDFLAAGGRAGVITDASHLAQALRGNAGTWIRPDDT